MFMRAQGHFNKIAWIRRMLAESPREDVEWIMWMDMDTLITDQAFSLPWARYDGYDMVVWGVRERVDEGEVEGEHSKVYTQIPISLSYRPCDSYDMILVGVCECV